MNGGIIKMLERKGYLSARLSCSECSEIIHEVRNKIDHSGNKIIRFICFKCKKSFKIIEDDEFTKSKEFNEIIKEHFEILNDLYYRKI